MKKLFILITLTIILNNCKSQNIKTMETFDKTVLKGQKKIIIKQKMDSIQEFGEDENAFYQLTYRDKSPYKSIKTFSKKDSKIRSVTNKFYAILIGEYKRYDENGKLIKDLNIDYDINFTINDLIERIKTDFNIDLLDSNGKDVALHNEGNNKYYTVLLAIGYPRLREIKISANDGSIISDKIIGYEK